jgi:hypothetical protein
MKILRRLAVFVFLVFFYLIVKEFLILYQAAYTLHPYAAYGVLILISVFLIYFAFIPMLSILRLPGRFAPTRNPDEIQTTIESRMKQFRRSPVLRNLGVDVLQISNDRLGYDQVLAALKPEVKKLHQRYVIQVFYSTAISQNGFLDALLILVLSINLVKDLFVLYHGRVPNRVLWIIGRMVIQSVLIGGSEGIEYVVDEVFSKMFSGAMKGIPFASKILGSLADGYVNAALVTRIALITQNYCEMVFIESERALYPAHKTVVSTTRILVSDLIERIAEELRSMTRNKTETAMAVVNPVGSILSKAMNRLGVTYEKRSPFQRDWIQETSGMTSPIHFLHSKLRELFRKKPSVKR